MNRPMTGTVQCPGCGEAMVRVVDGGVHYSCTHCRGRLVGLAPFEREHADGRRLWVAAADGAPAGPCPFCAGALLAPTLDGTAPGIAVCRRCEQVWVPADADQRLAPVATAAEPQAAARPLHPDQCPECGAPWAPDPAGRCRYCREQLAAADQPVVIIERAGAPGLGTGIGAGIAGAALGISEVLGIAERFGRG
jgi:hypothetical protein